MESKTLDLKILYFTSVLVPFASYISTDIFCLALILWSANILVSYVVSIIKKQRGLYWKVFFNTSFLLIMGTILLYIVNT